MEATAALVAEWRRSKIRIACVNRRATGKGRMREGWAAVILQRTKQRIGIDLVTRPIQITAAIVAADVVSVRGDSAAAVENVFTQRTGVEDCISSFNCP